MSNPAPLVLLVEDSVDSAEMYGTFLTHVGFRVTVATNAAEAFTKAVGEVPDVIVTDVRLPGGPDGLALAKKLRLDTRTTRLPIIVLTANAFDEDRARAYAAGCNLFLTKPCAPTALASSARALLCSDGQRHQRRQRAPSAQARLIPQLL